MRSSAALLAFAALLLAVALEARPPVRARHALVVAREPHAVDAGVAALKAGGNAVDAAIAVGFALAVTHPSAGNLGGGGFLLIRFADGRSTFLDFRERAPAAATRDMYLDAGGRPTADSVTGYRAAAVPGTVKGLEFAHRRYAKRPWASLLEPAVRLAERGFPVSHSLARSLRHSTNLMQFPESKRIFLRDGAYYEPGDILVQPELARTLERIALLGAKEFYEGETARIFADAMTAGGGLIRYQDLKEYAVVERTPLRGTYKGHEILTAPPPSSGGAGLLEMLGILEGSGYEKGGAGSAASIHFVAEAMRRFFADRSRHFGDPDFVRVPVAGLLRPDYLARLRSSIDPDRATPSDRIAAGDPAASEGSETTHYSVVDEQGNAVAVTYTLNGGFGCGVTLPGLGFLLNNEMDDFAAKPGEPNAYGLIQGEANAIRPGKRPLSSMTPTIVLRDGQLHMVLGSPGGPRIITTVLQVILNSVDFGLDIRDAVDRPRFHHQWKPDTLYMEREFSPDTLALLRSRGHSVETETSIGEVAAIAAEPGWLLGAADLRVEGAASGY
jgi:gamma-glutamyltranspeptidase/glutathione hydrolase